MTHVCLSCAACQTERCPYCGEDVSDIEYGCVNYTKLPVINNPNKSSTKCGECRFLFQKPRKDAQDKSYINCGAVAAMVRHIKPIPNCPYFKQLRRKQLFKRKKRSNKGRGFNQPMRPNNNQPRGNYSRNSDRGGYRW